MVVTSVEEDKIEVQVEGEETPIVLRPDQVAKHTKLRHAMALYSTQGRSLVGTIAVHDWNNPYFSPISLYVALSRAKESDKIWMAPKRKWVYRLRD